MATEKNINQMFAEQTVTVAVTDPNLFGLFLIEAVYGALDVIEKIFYLINVRNLLKEMVKRSFLSCSGSIYRDILPEKNFINPRKVKRKVC